MPRHHPLLLHCLTPWLSSDPQGGPCLPNSAHPAAKGDVLVTAPLGERGSERWERAGLSLTQPQLQIPLFQQGLSCNLGQKSISGRCVTGDRTGTVLSWVHTGQGRSSSAPPGTVPLIPEELLWVRVGGPLSPCVLPIPCPLLSLLKVFHSTASEGWSCLLTAVTSGLQPSVPSSSQENELQQLLVLTENTRFPTKNLHIPQHSPSTKAAQGGPTPVADFRAILQLHFKLYESLTDFC